MPEYSPASSVGRRGPRNYAVGRRLLLSRELGDPMYQHLRSGLRLQHTGELVPDAPGSLAFKLHSGAGV